MPGQNKTRCPGLTQLHGEAFALATLLTREISHGPERTAFQSTL